MIEEKQTISRGEQLRKARNEYQRRWRHAHPDNVKRINERFWAKQLQKHSDSDGAVNECE